MRLYIATTNPGKLRDFAAAAAAHGGSYLLEPLPGLGSIPAPSEDEPTFEGNARSKALYYSRHSPGQLVIADDSGLEVPVLGGAPGVRSARYAEDLQFSSPGCSNPDERNNAALLRALDGVPENRREGRYRCALALASDGKLLKMAEGHLDGRILTEPRGANGFGYDPLFFLPESGLTMAEIDQQTRLGFSHRVRALEALLRQLNSA